MANENFIKNAENQVNSDDSAGLISFEEANVVSDNASVSDIDNLINQLNAKKQEIMAETAEAQTSDDDGTEETSVLDMKVEDLSDNTENNHDSDNHDVEYFVLDSGNTENDVEVATPESAVEPAAEEPQEAKSEADHADAEPVVETAEVDAEVTNEPEPEAEAADTEPVVETVQANADAANESATPETEPEAVEEPEEKSIADLKAEKLAKMLHEDEVKEPEPVVEEPVKPRRRRGRPSTVVSDKASNEITTEYMLEVLNSNFSDIKDEELESRLFDYMSKRLVIDISKDYKSDIYQDAFVKRLFLWFVEDEEFVNNPLFDILIKECMDKEVNCEYLNPELTHKILEHIMSKDAE